ncbi:hypothetical protein NDU88_000736 [Pleurodeles waltl]|uniref:Uncharacterized protein n=1 Tax=Pleurodeles waltl TaxID=8319 RepID=A0AAV7U6A5_PLEWA|nr:hypothetical protein NDU88_000736 [Pleurodeles waltl]
MRHPREIHSPTTGPWTSPSGKRRDAAGRYVACGRPDGPRNGPQALPQVENVMPLVENLPTVWKRVTASYPEPSDLVVGKRRDAVGRHVSHGRPDGPRNGQWVPLQVEDVTPVPDLHKWRAMTLRWAQMELRVLRALRDKGQVRTGYGTWEALVSQLEIKNDERPP